MKPQKAFSVTDDTPKGTEALWAEVYRRIMARAADTIRKKYGGALSVAKVTRPEPKPGAFSVWPKKVNDNGKK